MHVHPETLKRNEEFNQS